MSLDSLGHALDEEAGFNADVSDQSGPPSRQQTPPPLPDHGASLDTPRRSRFMPPSASALAATAASPPSASAAPRAAGATLFALPHPLPPAALNTRRYLSDFPSIGQPIEEGFSVEDPGCSACVAKGIICSWGTGNDWNGDERISQCDYCTAQHKGKCFVRGFQGRNVGATRRVRAVNEALEAATPLVDTHVQDLAAKQAIFAAFDKIRRAQ